ncbi:MAG: acetylxylan esterase [Kiritimatiellae bacterium]|nr:acetylxylan esterase [Kiritimatiellia bacterium]
MNIKFSIVSIGAVAACISFSVRASASSAGGSGAPEPRNVPALLVSEDGKTVGTAHEWESVRRPELFNTFMREEYGVRPAAASERSRVSFKVADERDAMDGKAVRKLVDITYSGPCGKLSFRAIAFIPKTSKPAPAFLLICNRDRAKNHGVAPIDPDRREKSGFWPAEEIVARGYAAVTFYNGDVAPDDKKGGCRKGVFAAVEKRSARNAESWATISAWAWGASRVMDWIESEPLIDKSHVAVVGHSRGGKTALLAGATDKRFAMACSNNSGCSGAKLNHINLPKSESIKVITKSFPHWFCKNYSKYAGREMTMPFDQHEFIALIAPRLVAIASATEDHWAGQHGEWHAARLASPAWALYGKKGLVADAFPPPETPQQSGSISYHLRTGRHDLTPYDWKCYMDFADRHGWRD